MIKLPFADGKTYGVLGLGKSGRATVASLTASGARVLAWDDGEATRNATQKEFPTLEMHPIADWDFFGMASLVVSPGIFLTHEAVRAAKKHGVEVIGDIELLYRAQPHAHYIGITGTNGKSTTTSLIAHVLKACGKRVEMGGNIGVPALELAPLGADGVYVLELSSYQLDLVTTTQFHIAILLNISPDHIDHHGSMENYIAAKMHIFDRYSPPEFGTAYTAIIGIDDAITASIAHEMQSHRPVTTISTTDPHATMFIADGVLYDNQFCFDDETGNVPNPRGSLLEIKSLQGQHNWQNAAVAYAACMEAGVLDPKKIMAAMKTYPGLAHRMQWLGEVNGVAFVNDSKATNADAAEKALKTYDQIFWIAGGVAKEGGIEPLAPYFSKIRHAYLIGEAAEMFAKTLEGKVPYTLSGTLENAFAQAAEAATHEAQKLASTRSVVLAPACASFDQFANFEKRGEAFMALYEAWKKQGGTHAATAR